MTPEEHRDNLIDHFDQGYDASINLGTEKYGGRRTPSQARAYLMGFEFGRFLVTETVVVPQSMRYTKEMWVAEVDAGHTVLGFDKWREVMQKSILIDFVMGGRPGEPNRNDDTFAPDALRGEFPMIVTSPPCGPSIGHVLHAGKMVAAQMKRMPTPETFKEASDNGQLAKLQIAPLTVAPPAGKGHYWHAETCSSLYGDRRNPPACDCEGGDYCRGSRGIRQRGEIDT